MKRVFAFISVLLCTACSTVSYPDQLNAALEPYRGEDVRTVFDVLGFPDGETEIADKTVYVWQDRGVSRFTVPETSTIRASGGQTAQITYDRSEVYVYGCRLRLITESDIIEQWDISAQGSGCAPYAKRLTETHNGASE